MSIKKIFAVITLTLVLFIAAFSILNFDVALRLWNAAQDDRLSEALIRYEVASFNIGRTSPNVAVDAKTSSVDGMEQVYIPEGVFVMGSNKNPNTKEYPEHAVYLNAFWMDKVEVTNAMYEKCAEAGECIIPVLRLNPYYRKWAYRNLPVVYVNWYAAEGYCAWAGRRLPTEAEWEKAARGDDLRLYPWGDEKPNPRLANFAETLIGESIPVYRYPLGASPYGVLNMAGNVREWVADWFDKEYYAVSPRENPQGPDSGKERSLRGGAYDAQADNITTFNRFRHEPDSAGLSRGFRCADDTQ